MSLRSADWGQPGGSRESHPATQAWLALDPKNRVPEAVTALFAYEKEDRKKHKSSVYKLSGVGRYSGDIVAKRCEIATARTERIIYEQILPKLPVSSLRYRGFTEYRNNCWLFIEYADGMELDFGNRDQLDLAINWLATLHGYSTKVDELSLLPNRDSRHFYSQLTSAVSRTCGAAASNSLSPDEVAVMDDVKEALDLLMPLWPKFERWCELMPPSLVHADFNKKNVHVRSTESELRLLPFDWEMSGKGSPAVDLYWVYQKAPAGSLRRYWEQLRKYQRDIELHNVERLAKLGLIFRCIQSLDWASHSFSYRSYKRIKNAKSYAAEIKNVLGKLELH